MVEQWFCYRYCDFKTYQITGCFWTSSLSSRQGHCGCGNSASDLLDVFSNCDGALFSCSVFTKQFINEFLHCKKFKRGQVFNVINEFGCLHLTFDLGTDKYWSGGKN